MTDPIAYHAPVLLAQVLARAAGASRVLDATLGDGGHAIAFRDAGATVLAIDRDPTAIARARMRLGNDHIEYLETPYASDLALARVRAFRPDFILLDLGVSSGQIDQSERGFTFRPGAPLDMRMSQQGQSASDLLQYTSEGDLKHILRDYGDEPRSGRLAREIVRRRESAPFVTSDDLVNAIRAALGRESGPADFARIFQAVRIALNGELTGLAVALPAFRDALRPGGTLAVISYHSGEDRLVKQSFREWEAGCVCPPGLPQCVCGRLPLGRAVPRRAVIADGAEVAANPRARSARLRFFQVADAH